MRSKAKSKREFFYYFVSHLLLLLFMLSIVTPSAGAVTSGHLKVIISPQKAVEDGAQWKVTGESAWHNSGEILIDMPFRSYQIQFKPVSGYTTPKNIDVTLSASNPGMIIESDPYIITLELFTISGTVADLAGNGVTNARINAVVEEEAGELKVAKVAASAFSDNLGKFKLNLQANGEYHLTASREGYGHSTLVAYNTGEANAILPLNVIVNSSEGGSPRKTTIRILDNEVLSQAPVVTLLPGASGSLTPPVRKGTMEWELTYTAGNLDMDGELIGIKVEPRSLSENS